MGGALAIGLAARDPARIATLTLLAPAGLGSEINGSFIDAFVRASRRREATEALQLLVHDPSLVSRAMVEETLRYKRLDGVPRALETVAGAWFPQGRQAVDLRETLRALHVPVQVIWGREDQIIPAAHAEALAEGARVSVLENVGHLPHLERAGEVNRLIRATIA
jgi:pyruvate dehydrogenase E2 component (dihydrolipoamide acetyltransferase)